MIDKLNQEELETLLKLKKEYKRIYEEKPRSILLIAISLFTAFILTLSLILKNPKQSFNTPITMLVILLILAIIYLLHFIYQDLKDKKALNKKISDMNLKDYLMEEDGLILESLNHLVIDGSRSREVLELNYEYKDDHLILNIKKDKAYIFLDESHVPLEDQYGQSTIYLNETPIHIPAEILNKQLKLHKEKEAIRYEVHFFEFYKNKNLDKVKAISDLY